MPDLYRLTLIMEGMSQGWSESYVIPRDGVNVRTVNSGITNFLASARGQLLGRQYTLTAFRTTKIRLADGTPVKRNSDLVISSRGPGGTTVAWDGAQPRECVICNGVSADGTREKKVYLRGVPDDVITKGGELNRNEQIGWFSRLDSFFAQLLTYQAGWLVDQTTGETANVDGYVNNANLTQTVTFETTIFETVPVGTRVRVRLSGINNGSRLNGVHEMIVTAPVSATTTKPLAVGPYVAGGEGVMMTDPKPFISAVEWGAEIARTRQTGKVSVGSRGRQSATPRI